MALRSSLLVRISLIIAVACTLFLFLHLHDRVAPPLYEIASVHSLQYSVPNISRPPILPDYAPQATDPEWCESKYSTAYLTSLRDGRRSYCDQDISESSLDCFGTTITDEREDVFCIARKTSLSHTQQATSFKLDCAPWEDPGVDSLTATLAPHTFPRYMYNTGLFHIYDSYFSTVTGSSSEQLCQDPPGAPKYTILLKREGAGNLWHSLLEIFSLYLTIDVLRISPADPSIPDSEPLLSAADISSTQLVVLDDHPDGPYFDLWKLFAPLPIVRLKDLPSSHAPRCLDNVIIPLAGGSNPLWRGDWHSGACTHSQLLDVFSTRVLTQYRLGKSAPPQPKSKDAKLTLTFINRTSSRVLLNMAEHLDNLRAHFPNVHIQAIDFATIPFAEQLRVVQGTDVLVGVHGAGMTHSMFLPDESSVVEILPRELDYKVFRNLAKLKGHKYFSAHAETVGTGDWHDLNVRIDEDRFLELVEAGIRVMYHRGIQDNDVI